MDEQRQSKPPYVIGIDQAVEGDDITVTAKFQLTPEGMMRLVSWTRGIAPQIAAMKTSEGTIYLVPPNKK